MIYRLLFVVALAVIAVLCLFAARMVRHRPLKPFARNLLVILLVLELVLALLHVFTWTGTLPPFWVWFFDVQSELNLPALFSSTQLVVIGLIALVNGWRAQGLVRWQRAYWLLLALVFFYLGYDEFYMIHETLGGGHAVTEYWRLPYGIAGAILFLISVGAYLYGFRQEIRLFVLLFMGLGIMMLSGVVLEELVIQGWPHDRMAERLFIFEESLEMIGATIVLGGFIAYGQAYVGEAGWRFEKRFVALGGLLWTGWLFFAMLLQPALEARFLAKPVQVDYDGGKLSLLGYTIAPEVVRPGDEVAITLYWRANQPLTEDYSLSVHALTHPNIETVAQSDNLHAGPIPSTGWFPHVVMRRVVYLQLPAQMPTPASYWLMVRVWSGPWPWLRPWEDTQGLPITQTDQTLMAEDMLVLDSLTALSNDAPEAPTTPASYRFTDDGFTLYGYELPATTEASATLPIRFWWQAEKDVAGDFTQFFHLRDTSSGAVFPFDQQPFGGSFPTSAWSANMRVADSWYVTLPTDLPTGAYAVYTGMYDPVTVERRPIVGADGQPVLNNEILLGELRHEVAFSSAAETEARLEALCYAVADQDESGGEPDRLAALDRTNGEFLDFGLTGTQHVEAITFSLDGTAIYTVDELENTGLFGLLDPQTGQFTPVGEAVAPEDNPARNAALGEDALKDVDSMAVDPRTGIVWAASQDEKNFLFQLDVATGAVVRDAFGPGTDYVKIDLTGLDGPEFSDVEDLAIDPADGTFYVIAANDDYRSQLARLNFDGLSLDTGLVPAVTVASFVSTADGDEINDMEGLSFASDGKLYGTTSNNSNVEANYNALWEIDPRTGEATQVGRFTHHNDYESVACYVPPATTE